MENNQRQCQLCNAETSLTFHHLIPKTCHRNKWFRKHFSVEQMRTSGIIVCRKCHSFIHKQFSEKELGREFYTLERLLAHPTIANYISWAKKQHR